MESTPASLAQRIPFERVLGCLGIVTFGENAAGSTDLDEVGAVFDVLANLVLDLGNAVGYAVTDVVILDRQEVVVAVTAGDAHCGSADEHVRPGDLSGVDGIAEIDVHESAGTDVANGGESGQESFASIHDAIDGFLGGGGGDFVKGVEISVHRQVGVNIHETGKDGHAAKIDDLIARLWADGAAGRDGLDGVADDDDGLRVRELAGLHIKKMPGTDQGSLSHFGVLLRRPICRSCECDEGNTRTEGEFGFQEH
jgi:hypothetical protein